jgi:hypothetical protein
VRGEDRIDAGGVGADGGVGRDVAPCEGERCGAVDAFAPFQPDTPRLVAVGQLDADHDRRLDGAAAAFAAACAGAEIGLVDLHEPLERAPARVRSSRAEACG